MMALILRVFQLSKTTLQRGSPSDPWGALVLVLVVVLQQVYSLSNLITFCSVDHNHYLLYIVFGLCIVWIFGAHEIDR